jgi:nucleotide-binding universal stress UspA family protein
MTIVLGYIPTAQGEAALTFAIEEALLRKTELLVVNSGKGESLIDEHFAQPKQLDIVREKVEMAGLICHLRHRVRGQNGAHEVLDVAEEAKATMIVIGTGKRSPVESLLLGSDTSEIVAKAHCPIMIVNAASESKPAEHENVSN